jgi:tetratricopeptide (TPR) repeat protein
MEPVPKSDNPFADAHYVQDVYISIQPFAAAPQTRASASGLFSRLIETELGRLQGSADEWFNLATLAAQVRNYGAVEKILTAAIEIHPEDVDLRCEWFQFAYGHIGITAAKTARESLEALGRDKTATFWRYWCYNATFESQYLGNKEEGVTLLDDGLRNVPPAGLLNVYRVYRTVLIDGSAHPSLRSKDWITDHTALVARVKENYQEGLALGIEAGYVLAVDLARLLRERTTGMQTADADKELDEALRLLDIAERAYTDDGNHPLWDIYLDKAIVLMARRRYEDALQIFRSLPSYRLSDSMKAMAQYAANMTGQEFKPADISQEAAEDSDLPMRVATLERAMQHLLSQLSGEEVDDH